MWVCLCASDEKEEDERGEVTEFVEHREVREKKRANVKLIK